MTGVQTCALRSEEHTSELQSHDNLVCRLLLEKKKALGRDRGGRARRRHRPRDRPPRGTALDDDPRTAGVLFFFNDTATTEIYTLSLHDALPISGVFSLTARPVVGMMLTPIEHASRRSEEHTSELQSHDNLVCRLLLEKKKH